MLGNFLYGPENPCGEGIIPHTCTCPDGASFTPDLRFALNLMLQELMNISVQLAFGNCFLDKTNYWTGFGLFLGKAYLLR